MKNRLLTQSGQSSMPLLFSVLVIGAVVGTAISISNVTHAIRQHNTVWKAGAGFLTSEKAAWASFSKNDTSGCGTTQRVPASVNGSQPSIASRVCLKRPVAEGYYTVSPKNSGLCMEVQNNSKENTALIIQDTCVPNQASQVWQVVKLGSGFQLISANSGNCLDVQGVSKSSGALLQQYTCLGPSASNQIFYFAPVDDGSWQVKPLHTNDQSCLTVNGGPGMTSPGAYISNSTCAPGFPTTQDWVFTPAVVAPTVVESGFESPHLANGAFQYSPASTVWSFGGLTSGIAANGSIFNNPAAPEGNQVGLIQTWSEIEQYVNFPTTGSFVVSLKAAQRPGYPSNPVRILVDGTEVGYFTPTSSNFAPVTSNVFTVSNGTHSLVFYGTNGSESATFIDAVSIAISPLNTQPLNLQGQSSVTRSLILPRTGMFYVSLKAKNSANSTTGGSFTISINSKVVGTVNVNSANFVNYDSNSFDTVPGAYTLTLQGAGGTSVSAMIDSLAILPALDSTQANTSYPMSPYAASNDVLWPVNAIVDGDPRTPYSSHYFATSTNDRWAYVAAWLTGVQNVSQVQLTARAPANLTFPLAYDVYLTSADNSQWLYIGNYNNQPSPNGVAVIPLGKSYKTWGVLVMPTVLGVDDFGSHYFQLAEVKLAP